MVKCSICNKEIEASEYDNSCPILCSSECFKHYFWDEKVKSYGNGTSGYAKTIAIIEGCHYTYHPDTPGQAPFRGFGGREFKIRFNDGREITTHNLWHQGDIPETHKHLLPNNAVFIKEKIKL